MWCSWVSSSSGSLWPTWRISTLVIARPPSSSELPLVVGECRHRLVAVQGEDARPDQLDVEERPHAEPRAVGGDAADERDGGAAEHAEAHVVDHLPGADLEYADARRALRRLGDRVGG